MGKGTHLTDADHDEIWDLYAQGLNADEIHRLVGRSYSTVEKVFRSSGGIRPQPKFRSKRALTIEEREEIARAARQRDLRHDRRADRPVDVDGVTRGRPQR